MVVHPAGADNKAVSGLCFRNALVGSGWATAILLCTNGLRKQSSCPISCGETFVPVWASVGTFRRLVLRLSTLYQCCTGIWYEVEAKPSHYIILLVTCSESVQGEVCVSGILKHILQPYREVSLFREHRNWFLIQIHFSPPVQSSDCSQPSAKHLFLKLDLHSCIPALEI